MVEPFMPIGLKQKNGAVYISILYTIID
jgi:hypothetical protein